LPHDHRFFHLSGPRTQKRSCFPHCGSWYPDCPADKRQKWPVAVRDATSCCQRPTTINDCLPARSDPAPTGSLPSSTPPTWEEVRWFPPSRPLSLPSSA
jgi:hypothetical protein